MRNAADHLAFLHAELQGSAAPSYDVSTAFEVQQTGDAPKSTPSFDPASEVQQTGGACDASCFLEAGLTIIREHLALLQWLHVTDMQSLAIWGSYA